MKLPGGRIKVEQEKLIFDLAGVKHLAFDWDGTLFNNLEQLYSALTLCYQRDGNEENYEEYEQKFGRGGIYLWTKDLLNNLPFKAHLVTNKSHRSLHKDLQRNGIHDSIFATITTSAKKPSDIKVLTNIAKKGLYVGDSFGTDLPVAVLAGWDFQYLAGSLIPDEVTAVKVTT